MEDNWERRVLERLATDGLREQRRARRWGIFFKLLAFGFLAGALAAWAATRIVRHQWPELPAGDSLIWLGAAIVLSGGVALASWLPARRASRVDPIIALRAE